MPPVAARATGKPRAVAEERLAVAAGPEGLEGTALVDQARQTLAALRAAAGEANE